MMTTSSRPWTLTRWGPSLRTRRTSSLKRALASWSCQWPGSAADLDVDFGMCAPLILVRATRIYQTLAEKQATNESGHEPRWLGTRQMRLSETHAENRNKTWRKTQVELWIFITKQWIIGNKQSGWVAVGRRFKSWLRERSAVAANDASIHRRTRLGGTRSLRPA